mmetsp:Transcript_9313/g.20187  ORF Transcript_9313/g.20187 Transcript_9313/m.20187 type:complete len:409 (+) Transcript_9313:264-1490(+)
MSDFHCLSKINQDRLQVFFGRNVFAFVVHLRVWSDQDIVFTQIAVNQSCVSEQSLDGFHHLLIQCNPLGRTLSHLNLPNLWCRPPIFAKKPHKYDVLFIMYWVGHRHLGAIRPHKVSEFLFGPHLQLTTIRKAAKGATGVAWISIYVFAASLKFFDSFEHLDGNIIPIVPTDRNFCRRIVVPSTHSGIVVTNGLVVAVAISIVIDIDILSGLIVVVIVTVVVARSIYPTHRMIDNGFFALLDDPVAPIDDAGVDCFRDVQSHVLIQGTTLGGVGVGSGSSRSVRCNALGGASVTTLGMITPGYRFSKSIERRVAHVCSKPGVVVDNIQIQKRRVCLTLELDIVLGSYFFVGTHNSVSIASVPFGWLVLVLLLLIHPKTGCFCRSTLGIVIVQIIGIGTHTYTTVRFCR